MFLDRERLTVYPRIFAALYLLIGGWWLLSGPGLLDRAGKPLGGDFVTFYAASELLEQAGPAALFDVEALHAVEQAVIGAELSRFAWHYPPPAMLAVLPLSWLPYGLALGLWLLASLGIYLLVLRHSDPGPTVDRPVLLGLALAFPGLFQCLIQGQNGCLSLALLGGGVLLLRSRPWLGGLLLGALCYKPHLMPLAGLALLAGRQWRGLGGLVLGAGGLSVAATLVLGVEGWTAFLNNLPFARAVLMEGGVSWAKMPTTAAALLLLGAPGGLASAGQAVVSAVACAAVALTWWQRRPGKEAALALGALLATPFAFDYDLALLALPLLLIGRRAAPMATSTKALLVVGWLLPFWGPGLAALTGLQLAPLVLLALLWQCTRR